MPITFAAARCQQHTDTIMPASPWRFALALLGLAAALIIIGAAYPEFSRAA